MYPDIKIKYVSASGDVLELSKWPYNANAANLPSWKFDVSTLNSAISGFTRFLHEFKLPVLVIANTEAEAIWYKNRLYEVPAKDLEAGTPGRLYFNDWYIVGYIRQSDVGDFWETKRAARYELVFKSESQRWTRDYLQIVQPAIDASGLDYPHDHDHDYTASVGVASVENPNFIPSPFKMEIYGPVLNPVVEIGDTRYAVEVDIADGDRLEVDSRDKTVSLISVAGDVINVFSKRVGRQVLGSGEYIFEPIKPGYNPAAWEGDFVVAITIYEERAEPRWE